MASCRVDLARQQVYVLMSNGHIHVWRLHGERSPTLVCVWDKLTPNQKDMALSMSLMPRGQLDPKLADMQGPSFPAMLLRPAGHAYYICLLYMPTVCLDSTCLTVGALL